MRTTVTLDDDVALKLQALTRETGAPFKEVLNQTLREGLLLRRRPKPRVPFKVKPLGPGVAIEFESTSQLLEQLDELEHRTDR
ncbi:MAG: hypothetical protein HY820_41365 [Acidobacteria bacterium]|nr:hypothetical protein [Acidobacteriota bacterium]